MSRPGVGGCASGARRYADFPWHARASLRCVLGFGAAATKKGPNAMNVPANSSMYKGTI
jgi:hypothetical protein